MTQAQKSRIAPRLWIPLAVVAAVAVALLQGFGVFTFEGFGGSFLSFTGAKCVAIPLGIEAVLLVVILKNLDELHARSVSNPHSPLGQALRNDANAPPAPPPTREAWKGGFEDMDRASDKMSKDR
ncbi:MAG: hypothetical protein ACLQFW_13220 [Xanthobacteraceae bacterium]